MFKNINGFTGILLIQRRLSKFEQIPNKLLNSH
nr:MAG TPA_asm: hypothetical protein [Caudoviricetes sp.]